MSISVDGVATKISVDGNPNFGAFECVWDLRLMYRTFISVTQATAAKKTEKFEVETNFKFEYICCQELEQIPGHCLAFLNAAKSIIHEQKSRSNQNLNEIPENMLENELI